MLSPAEIITLINSVPAGYKSPEDDCFVAANKTYIPEYKKLGVISIADEAEVSSSTEYFCNVPGCQLIFKDTIAYQTHFNNVHRYLCSVCRRSLPTPYLLDLHVSERHDSYFATLVERGKAMYACFLEECKQKMLTQEQRKDHCISVHNFPGNYRFEQLCGKTSNSKKSERKEKGNETAKTQDTIDFHEGNSSVLGGKTFSFGHPKEKTFDTKNKPRSKDSFKDLDSLKDALDEI